MAEIGKVGSGGVPPGAAGANTGHNTAANRAAPNAPIGQPGALGQPTGMPVPAAPVGTNLLPDVLAGRDPSQLLAAERMRASGGASAVERQLGLNLQPSVFGALTAPPGNLEALRHMTPTMRRTIMRRLLDKQRGRMGNLAGLVRRNQEQGDREGSEHDEQRGSFASALMENSPSVTEEQAARAREEFGRAARMLVLLDELLAMQDYAISQMGTFSQG